MKKTAQKRKLVNRLKDTFNLEGKIFETFNSQFKVLMKELREKDDLVRNILLGKNEASDSGAPVIPFKDLLKLANEQFSRSQYLSCVSSLGIFHEKTDDVIVVLKQVRDLIDSEKQKFLLQDVDEKSREQLRRLKSRLEKKSSMNDFAMISIAENKIAYAGIFNWFNNLKKEQALKAWERRYPNHTKALKENLKVLLTESNKMYGFLLLSLDKMDGFSKRQLEPYVGVVGEIFNKYQSYNDAFSKFYHDYVKKYMPLLEKIPDAQPKPTQQYGDKSLDLIPELNSLNQPKFPVGPAIPDLVFPDSDFNPTKINSTKIDPDSPTWIMPEKRNVPRTVDMVNQPPVNQPSVKLGPETANMTQFKPLPSIEITPNKQDLHPDISKYLDEKDTFREEELGPSTMKSRFAHKKFIEMLKKISNEEYVVKSLINKYASSIRNKDVKFYNTLINVMNSNNIKLAVDTLRVPSEEDSHNRLDDYIEYENYQFDNSKKDPLIEYIIEPNKKDLNPDYQRYNSYNDDDDGEELTEDDIITILDEDDNDYENFENNDLDSAPITQRSILAKNREEFMKIIASFGNESPNVLKGIIFKYASRIKNTDQEFYIHLRDVLNKIEN